MPEKYADKFEAISKNSKWNGECLESTYKTNSKRFQARPFFTYKSKLLSVARTWWEIHNGPIPKGIFLCHHCDNPKCFRIEHLFLGSHRDNMQDMIKKGRDNNWGRKKYPKEMWEEVKRLREDGYSYIQISKKLNAKTGAISAFCNRRKIKAGPPKPRKSKYTQEIMDKIMSLKNEGMKNIDIYKKLKINESALYRMQRVMKGLK